MNPPPNLIPQPAHPQPQRPPSAPANEDSLIIGLFALRLTRQLIASLPHYSHKIHALAWLDAFLAPFDPAYDLAKITDAAKEDFLATHPRLLSDMKRQPAFPPAFMAMNPTAPPKREAWTRQGGMTDADRKAVVDFVDAASEWGSTVLVPREEGESILRMAGQRLVADLAAGRGGVRSLSEA